ncbi:Do family serine endopeptidase [Rickettsiales endosymbiont of Peranema trichophorum]|uniref:Do family serine endopeptidase n=1 Tax=Rickettsiales endosymbiont of Peranema trichophorum TaxID=2486577 RepID=UPI0013EE54B3|nr:Do family serine endopeptidase [Rickettsiales endosymbiont of Peranema trichophorum]
MLIFNDTYCLAQQPLQGFADIVEKVSPAVVNVSSTQNLQKKQDSTSSCDSHPENLLEWFDCLEKEFGMRSKSRRRNSLGSGFIIDKEGHIVTNYHVVAEADEINVTLGNDNTTSYKAKVVGKDRMTDLALLKIDAGRALPYVDFGDPEKSRVGDWVIAIGNPFGLGGTVTAGIISTKGRYLDIEHGGDYIQTDAPINTGSSGGPMFNLNGEVIGVSTLIVTANGGNVGVGFAIPSSTAKFVIEQLKQKGEMVRGWLGVKIQPVDQKIAHNMGLKEAKGALVASVVSGSPAEIAKLEVGDIIVKFDGKDVLTSNRLPMIVASTPINKKVDIQIVRNRQEMTLSAVIGNCKKNRECSGPEESATSPNIANNNILGMELVNINKDNAKKYRLENITTGVLIVSISRNSPAAEVGIVVGEVIQQVNNRKIKTVQDFENVVLQLKREKEQNATLLVMSRNGDTRFVSIELDSIENK